MIKKTAFVFFALLLLICSAAPFDAFADDPLCAYIQADDTNVGEVFTVKVMIDANHGFSNGSYNVVFDTSKVKLVSATADTELMKGVGHALNDKYTENSVRISFSGTFDFGFNGGELMVLQFEAINPGKAVFAIEKLKLASDQRYPTIDSSVTIMINGTTEDTISPSESATTSSIITTGTTEDTISPSESATTSSIITTGTTEDTVSPSKSITTDADKKETIEQQDNTSIGMLIGAVIAVIILIGAIAFVIYRKKTFNDNTSSAIDESVNDPNDQNGKI